jgi:hypothetical protein
MGFSPEISLFIRPDLQPVRLQGPLLRLIQPFQMFKHTDFYPTGEGAKSPGRAGIRARYENASENKDKGSMFMG